MKSIVRELGGEKVDIIRHHEDPNELLHEALKPAVPKNVRLDKDARRIYFEVAEDDMSIAIGRRGQNARLTSRLLGWRLDIEKEEKKEVGFDQRKAKAEESLTQIGIEEDIATRLVTIGLISAEAFEGVTEADLVDAGLSVDEAAEVLGKVTASSSNETT